MTPQENLLVEEYITWRIFLICQSVRRVSERRTFFELYLLYSPAVNLTRCFLKPQVVHGDLKRQKAFSTCKD